MPENERDSWDNKLLGIKDAYRRYLYTPADDEHAVDCVYSCYLSGLVKDMADKAWLWMVGPAGCSKTETVRPFEGHSSALFRDDLTANAFVSGDSLSQEEQQSGCGLNDPSLAVELVDKTLVCKDFAALRSRDIVELKRIMSFLRSAYDGSISKHSGKAGVGLRQYNVRFGLLLVTTPLPEKLRWSFQQIGERLFTYRFLRGQVTYDVVHSMVQRAVANTEKDAIFRAEFRDIVWSALDYVKVKANDHYARFVVTEQDEEWMTELAVLACRIRTSPNEERQTHGEVGTRLAKQIRQVAVCHAFWCGRNWLEPDDRAVALRLCYDSIPHGLLRTFNAILYYTVKNRNYVGTVELAEAVNTPVEELQAILTQYEHEGLIEPSSSASQRGSTLRSYRIPMTIILQLLRTGLITQAYSQTMKVCEKLIRERYTKHLNDPATPGKESEP
jgi:hypothetical protein